jgi:hypothetical protein
MKRYKLDSLVRVRSKGKMIKTAPSDTLRPPFGAQQSSHTFGARSSRQVDLWTTRFSNSIRQRGTSWRSSQRFGRRTGHACLERGAVPQAPKAAIPSAKRNSPRDFRTLARGARSSVMRQDHGGSVEYKNTWLSTPRHRQRFRRRPPTSNSP